MIEFSIDFASFGVIPMVNDYSLVHSWTTGSEPELIDKAKLQKHFPGIKICMDG